VRLVTNYGLDGGLGITTYAPPPARLGFMQKSFEVTVDNIDADLFGTAIPGGAFQPSDANWHRMRSAAAAIVQEAYAADMAELTGRRAALDAAADALLLAETLTGAELDAIIDAHPPAEGAAAEGAAAPAPARGGVL
jgi:hypothetical protein